MKPFAPTWFEAIGMIIAFGLMAYCVIGVPA